jgi:hypothetical protein
VKAPTYETATGPAGTLADHMGTLSQEIWGADWTGGLEHHLWRLYLLSLEGPEPSPGSTGARIRRFGSLVICESGLWIWPMEEPGVRWARLAEFEPRHVAWQARRARL